MRLGLHLRLYLHPDALRDTDLFRPGGVSVSEMGRCAEESVRDQLIAPEFRRRGLTTQDPGSARKYPDLAVGPEPAARHKGAFDVKSRKIVRWDEEGPYLRLSELGGLVDSLRSPDSTESTLHPYRQYLDQWVGVVAYAEPEGEVGGRVETSTVMIVCAPRFRLAHPTDSLATSKIRARSMHVGMDGLPADIDPFDRDPDDGFRSQAEMDLYYRFLDAAYGGNYTSRKGFRGNLTRHCNPNGPFSFFGEGLEAPDEQTRLEDLIVRYMKPGDAEIAPRMAKAVEGVLQRVRLLEGGDIRGDGDAVAAPQLEEIARLCVPRTSSGPGNSASGRERRSRSFPPSSTRTSSSSRNRARASRRILRPRWRRLGCLLADFTLLNEAHWPGEVWR